MALLTLEIPVLMALFDVDSRTTTWFLEGSRLTIWSDSISEAM